MADLGNTSVISPTDASNGSGTMPSWLGSAAPSTLDDAGRALQGAVAREWENRSFAVTSSGSANAYVVAYTVAPAALRSGQVYSFITNFACTGSATVNINTLGAKTIKKDVAGVLTALSSGDMASGQFVMLAYNGTDMIWVNWQGAAAASPSGSITASGYTQNTAKLLGRTTASSGAIEEIGVDSTLTLSSGTLSVASAGYPPGHIYGCTMSNAADTLHDITVAAGSVRDETDTANMTVAAITKQIDAAWSVGTNAGGLNTGAVANDTWYEVMAIKRVDTGVVDVMFTTTANRATFPTNYTLGRRIGWVRYGTATILQFTQIDDYVTLTTQINDVSASPTTTAAQVTLTAPPNSIARFRASLNSTAQTQVQTTTVVFSEIVEGNVTPAVSTGIASLSVTGSQPTAGDNDMSTAGHFELRVSSTSQIEHDSATGGGFGGSFNISTYGWVDHRRRMSAT